MQSEPQLDDLYREIILDHYRRPRHRVELTDADVEAEGNNPLCGDEITLQLKFDGERISGIGFQGSGCSISQSSASMMTDAVLGVSVADADGLRRDFEAMMKEGAPPTERLGDLESLEGVKQFPVRIKCALLAWKVLQEALRQRAGATGGSVTVSTDDSEDGSVA